MKIIERIMGLLEENGLKQSDLCDSLNISASTLTNWKNRGTDPPSRFVIPICEFFGISPEYLLTGEEKNFRAVTAEEKRVLELFRLLDESDRWRTIGRMEEQAEKNSSQ